MKKSIVFLSALMLFLTMRGAGQPSQKERLSEARFDLVRRSLEFMATDETIFTNVTQPICAECKSKEDLISFIKTNRLTGAESRLYQWLIIPDNALTSDILTELKSRIIADLTSAPGKYFRKELASYKTYVQDMNAIVSDARLLVPENGAATAAPVPFVYTYELLLLLVVATVILAIRLYRALKKEKINNDELAKAYKDLKTLQVKLKEQEMLTRKSAGELAFLKDQLQLLEQELKSKKTESRESRVP